MLLVACCWARWAVAWRSSAAERLGECISAMRCGQESAISSHDLMRVLRRNDLNLCQLKPFSAISDMIHRRLHPMNKLLEATPQPRKILLY